ncbi:uncharacterized protein LOC114542444 isoform X2 [Dendronephthya gigantea]|uniref:uncharacterized protein LOC114542444 isoform X2 n=1 Tax=Dendronephthya gigantea TaxID=151771 RepID=UPI00106D166E|nr:uncharacterized protein LOC114542444 isoform X2 [Dendronephthya gigantea]
MKRRRNLKRTLPAIEIVSFGRSSVQRRKVTLTAPEIVDSNQRRQVGDDEETFRMDTENRETFAMNDGHEGDDEEESDDDQGEDEVTQYRKKQQRAAQGWEDIRDAMLRAVVELEWIPDGQLCSKCATSEANFRCLQCGAGVYYCEQCDRMFQPSQIIGTRLNPRPMHACQTLETKSITVISENGIPHHVGIVSCKCEPFSVTLTRLRLWPTSCKQPLYAFDFRLFDWMEAMLLECQVSLHDFCKALHFKLPPYVIRKKIYPLIIDCFEEYRFFKHRLRTLQFTCPELDYGNVCPACPRDNGVLIESFDALFGLPRKKSAGCSVREPLHRENIFNNQKEVDHYIENYPRKQSSQKDCSDFKAGDVLRSASQFKALDETAVFGSACRHGFPKQFLSLKHGERIGYAVWLIKKIANDNDGRNIEMKIMYDIACLLKRHLQASGQENLLESITLAVPAFHIYGHKGSCQLQYSPRRVDGFGLTDGEQLERLWSYLRRFGKMTKEMRPSHRIDVLSDAILHYSRQCKDTLVSKLIKNWKRATDCIEASSKSLSQLSKNSPVELTESLIQQLAETERQRLCGGEGYTYLIVLRLHTLNIGFVIFRNEKYVQQNTTKIMIFILGTREELGETITAESQTWESIYVDKLKTYYTLRDNLCEEGSTEDEVMTDVVKRISRLDKELDAIERSHAVTVRWTRNNEQYQNVFQMQVILKCKQLLEKMKPVSQERLFLLKIKEKYSDGHALSKKLAKQVKKSDKKLKEMVIQHNSFRDCLSVENRHNIKELQVSDLRLEVEGLLGAVEDERVAADRIPCSVRRQAIDMLHLLHRSKEEIQLVELEMNRVFIYFQSEESHLATQIEQLLTDSNATSYTTGSISLLKSTQKILQRRLLEMHASLKTYVNLPTLEFVSSFPNDSCSIENYNESSDSCPDETTTDDDSENE